MKVWETRTGGKEGGAAKVTSREEAWERRRTAAVGRSEGTRPGEEDSGVKGEGEGGGGGGGGRGEGFLGASFSCAKLTKERYNSITPQSTAQYNPTVSASTPYSFASARKFTVPPM